MGILSRLIRCALLLLVLPVAARGVTWHVADDGSGDFFTIADAVQAASDGDVILVAPGIYAEALVIEKSLALASTHGAELTVLDGGHAHQILNYINGGGGSLTGFTLTDAGIGPGSTGGAILAKDGCSLQIANCRFEGNVADFQGGGLAVGDQSEIQVDDSIFRNNYAPVHCGAAVVIQNSSLSFDRCLFIENFTGVFSGAIAAHSSELNANECLFLRNGSDDVSGAIYLFQSSGLITSNTFHDNTSPGHATVVIDESQAVTVARNIFSGETAGFGLQFLGAVGAHSCNLYWDNADGPIAGTTLAEDEIIADPRFCDADQDVFYLFDLSPGAPDNSPCGLLIGAFEVACSTTGVGRSSLSAIKALY